MFGRDKGDRLITRLKPILHANSGKEFAQRVALMLQPWNADFSAFKEDYEYRYKPVQQPKYDPVAATIRQVLKGICRDNVAFANAFVRVYGFTAAPPIWPRDGSKPEHTVKFYTFTQKGLEFPMMEPVAILLDFGKLKDRWCTSKWGESGRPSKNGPLPSRTPALAQIARHCR